jgi:hypothetical protein
MHVLLIANTTSGHPSLPSNRLRAGFHPVWQRMLQKILPHGTNLMVLKVLY